MGRPSKYTQEFRRDAVDLVRSSGRPINQVARELGMSHETLRNRVRAAERQAGAGEGSAGGEFATVCAGHGVRRSMGRVGSSYDNALAEAFFATFKRELDVDRRRWTTTAEARRDVFRWIAFYNHRRRHSALSHQSPTAYERQLRSATVQQIAA